MDGEILIVHTLCNEWIGIKYFDSRSQTESEILDVYSENTWLTGSDYPCINSPSAYSSSSQNAVPLLTWLLTLDMALAGTGGVSSSRAWGLKISTWTMSWLWIQCQMDKAGLSSFQVVEI